MCVIKGLYDYVDKTWQMCVIKGLYDYVNKTRQMFVKGDCIITWTRRAKLCNKGTVWLREQDILVFAINGLYDYEQDKPNFCKKGAVWLREQSLQKYDDLQ